MRSKAALPWRRRFLRDRRGATAVEFAILGLPFLLAMLAILEYGYVYLIGASLDNATTTAARLVRTGQVQTTSITYTDPVTGKPAQTSVPITADQFASIVCSNMSWIGNCKSQIVVSSQLESSWTGQTSFPPTANGAMQPQSAMPFNVGADNCIILIHSYLPWTMVTPSLWASATKLNNNSVVLGAASLIVNEPYSSGTGQTNPNACS